MRKINLNIVAIVACFLTLSVVLVFYFSKKSPVVSIFYGQTNLSEAGCILNSRKSVEKLGGNIERVVAQFIYGNLYGEDFTISCVTFNRIINISAVTYNSDSSTAKAIFDVYAGFETVEKPDSPIINRSLFANTFWKMSDLGTLASFCPSTVRSAAAELGYKLSTQTEEWSNLVGPDGSQLQVFCLKSDNKALFISSLISSRNSEIPLTQFLERFENNIKLETPVARDQFTNNILADARQWNGNFQCSRCQISAKNTIKSFSITPMEVNGGYMFEKDSTTVLVLCAAQGNLASIFYSWPKNPASGAKIPEDVFLALQNRIK